MDKLQRALKCKEVWVEGSYTFRNPSEDMPSDWDDEQRRILHYQELGSVREEVGQFSTTVRVKFRRRLIGRAAGSLVQLVEDTVLHRRLDD